jgi:AraC-like DNA-binding protein
MINVHDFLQAQGEEYRRLIFKDLLFVHYRCPQQERYDRLYTPLNYFVYVISGQKTFHHPGHTYPLNEGTCAFIRKGGFTQERFFDVDWRLMAFFVADGYLREFVKEYRAALPAPSLAPPAAEPVILLHVTELTRAFFDSMIPFFFQPGSVSEQLVELKFREMVFHLLSDPENHVLLSYLCRLEEGAVSLQEVMEANFLYNLSLEQFARIANRSLSAFKREFVALYKMPPGKWLLNRRLDHAEVLLRRSVRLVAEIAAESGFENPTHFNRVFKQRFGVTPLQYREAGR